jgi:DNA-binding SARP family transcriptional activator
LQFWLLGPVDIATNEGHRLGVGAPKRRAVLAALALKPNRVLMADELIDIVWGPSPPSRVRSALHGHISSLRKLIRGPATLVSVAQGYQLRTDPAAVDRERFQTLIATARSLPPDQAVIALVRALRLWQGDALTGTSSSHRLDDVAAYLNEERMAAVEELGELLLGLQRAPEAVALLGEYVAEHRLRECLIALMVRALSSCGRHRQAAETYHATRAALARELDVTPGPSLERAYRSLTTDHT